MSRRFLRRISWSFWSSNCSSVYVGYPESIPDGTAVPQWAFQDVAPSGSFNIILAQAVGDSPESVAATALASTTTATTYSISITAGHFVIRFPYIVRSGQYRHNRGSAVGSVVGLAIGAVATLYFISRCKGGSKQPFIATHVDAGIAECGASKQ